LSEDNHNKRIEEHKERKYSSGVDLSLSICFALFALFFALSVVK